VTDLMHAEEIRRYVRDAYASITSAGGVFAKELYSPEELALVPASAIDLSLGVANHLRWAELPVGAAVLDIGCGAGIDSILAAHRVGPDGTVVALDFLPEMLERTSEAAAEAELGNIRPLQATMEAIPIGAATVDVVLSNGAINLSPRKARVFAECARVLRPGGRLCVSDITIDEEDLPPEVLTHPAAWAG
jgi:arsenite methyltransferase